MKATPAPAGASASAAAKKPKSTLTPAPIKEEDFKNDPLIQKALEVFKGRIIEVRA